MNARPPIETFEALAHYLQLGELDPGDDVFIQPNEWSILVRNVGRYNVVYGTADEPPFFWFGGRRIRQLRPGG